MKGFSVFMARRFTWIWCRYWASRIQATIFCSRWLSAERQEIEGFPLFLRRAITLALFVLPVRSVVSVRLRFEE